MPRVSRFVTEFEAGGHTWVAEFTHKHAREDCPHRDPDSDRRLHIIQRCTHRDKKGRAEHPKLFNCPHVKVVNLCPEPVVHPLDYKVGDKTIQVQHITSVRLRYKDDLKLSLSGDAPCSLRDTYKWQPGVHLAMQRALEKAKLCKLVKRDGRIVVEDKKPLYTEVMEAFWRELQRKAPKAPQETPTTSGITPGGVVTGSVGPLHLQSARPMTPYVCEPENRYGTYYAGAD